MPDKGINNPSVSVIVPTFNTAKYICRCLDSLLSQTLQGIEIIVIDDCSSDETCSIVQEYAEKYDNITLIKNIRNHGTAYCRNKGIEEAKSKYIGFVDSDDYVYRNYYEKLYEKAIEENTDIVFCDTKTIYQDGNEIRVAGCKEKLTKYNVINNPLAASCCNKLFKKEHIQKYRFIEGEKNEDIASVIPAIVFSKSMGYVPEIYYNYVQREGSVQRDKEIMNRMEVFSAVEKTLKRIEGTEGCKVYRDAIVFNQLILFLLYAIPTEKDASIRYEALRAFRKKIKGYRLRGNRSIQSYLSLQGRAFRLYSKAAIFLISFGMVRATNILMRWYHLYKESKKGISQRVTEIVGLDDIENAAKRQAELSVAPIRITSIVPNYNYERFLLQRVFSILNQSYKIHEMIILDDGSLDGSISLINEIYDKISPYIKIKIILNEKNSGNVYRQWKRGIDEAEGGYIWIAEADDYCYKDMLKLIAKPIEEDNDVVMSYCDTAFINPSGTIFLKSVRPLIDLMHKGHWDNNYVEDGDIEIKKYAYLNCTIGNVSSAVFKKMDTEEIFLKVFPFKQAGDWVFYLEMMRLGKVSYSRATLNYYRMHGDNVTNQIAKQKYYKEIVKVHDIIRKEFGLTASQERKIRKRQAYLRQKWNIEQ